MLRRACIDGMAWPGLTVAVNVSPLQFRRSDFFDVVERTLAEVCAGRGIAATVHGVRSFRPGRPTPTHRYARAGVNVLEQRPV